MMQKGLCIKLSLCKKDFLSTACPELECGYKVGRSQFLAFFLKAMKCKIS